MDNNFFLRYELKYIMDQNQKECIEEYLKEYAVSDINGNSKIYNLYLDTPNNILTLRSIERPSFKEKIRVRSYNKPSNDNTYIEIKRKYNNLVYKRRINIGINSLSDILINNHIEAPSKQLNLEFNKFFNKYNDLRPKIAISYDRAAYYMKNNSKIRITIDSNLMSSTIVDDYENYEPNNLILNNNQYVLEIKTPNNLPFDLIRKLKDLNLYKTTFSKLETAYKNELILKEKI